MMNRLIVTRIAVLLLFVTLVGRLYQLQLVDTEQNRLRTGGASLFNKLEQVRPQRGEVFAADGRTLLAESVPIFTAAIRPSALPPENDRDLQLGEPRRAEVYAQLSQILGITSTLTISPADTLARSPLLKNDLDHVLGGDVTTLAQRDGLPTGAAWLNVAVPPTKSLLALKLRDTYSNTVTLQSPIGDRVNRRDVAGYQTMVIKRDIPRNVALVLRENANNLPGVVVERDWRRRYPLSSAVPSFSHLLGYIGSIDECDLVRNNASRTWITSMLDSIGHSVKCGTIGKQVDPYDQVPRYLNEDRIGRDGVEASYERELRGQLGVNSVVVDVTDRPVEAPKTYQPVTDGANIVLTIDTTFQKQVEHILQNWIDLSEQRRQSFNGVFDYKRTRYQPIKSGVAVVSEVKTGRVLAMVSLPSYDNNIYVDPQRSAELTAILAPPTAQLTETQRLGVLYNRAIGFTYPAGSTMKQFDAVIALRDGVITPDTQVFDAGKLLVQNIYNPTLQDPYVNSNSTAHGWITVRQALEVSSNIFFMSVVGGNKEQVVNLKPEEQTLDKPVGIERFKQGLNAFGFGAPSGIKLPNERGGVVPSPAWKSDVLHEQFTTGDLYNMAIGQGNLRVTPLQLNAAGAAIANGGKLYQPQLVDRVVASDGKLVQQMQPTVMRDLQRELQIDPAYFAVAREGMRQSVTNGANKAARFECSGLQIAGKTGTAEYGEPLIVPNGNGKGTHATLRSHAWFVGFAPYDDPQIEVTVLVEGAGDMNDGSATIAVPAVTQIMQAYFKTTPPNPLPAVCQKDLPPLPAPQNYSPVQPGVAPKPIELGR